MSIEQFIGTYHGRGTWYEINGDSAGYAIEQCIEPISEGLKIELKHDHANGPTTTLECRFVSAVSHLYQVQVADKVIGRGYCLNDSLSFYFDNKYLKPDLDSVTEINFRMADPGELTCYGSSTKNSAGNYIMWYEFMNRV